MRMTSLAGLALLSCSPLIAAVSLADNLTGQPAQISGADWQSAYIDIDPPKDFRKGDQLIIRVEGTAEFVKVRLLPDKGKADSAAGVVGSKIKVPAEGKIVITLDSDRPQVKQISVHAGKKAWGEVINPNGGEVGIQSIELIRSKSPNK